MKKVVVLTGAGMSAESGLSTFRDSGGLWDRYPVGDVALLKDMPAIRSWSHVFIMNAAVSCKRWNHAGDMCCWQPWSKITM